MAEAWVYVLRCADDSLYTGWTIDLQRRLARHQAGTASRYTASRLPVVLAWSREMPDRRAARREEARIKQLGRKQKLVLIAGRTSGAGPASALLVQRAQPYWCSASASSREAQSSNPVSNSVCSSLASSCVVRSSTLLSAGCT